MIRYLLVTLALCFALATEALATPGTGSIGAVQTNPAANAVIVTTPALTSGSVAGTPSANWHVVVIYSCSVAATLDFQSVNGSGTAMSHIYLNCAAASTNMLQIPNISFSIPNGWTVQVMNVSSITGTEQASIFYALETVN